MTDVVLREFSLEDKDRIFVWRNSPEVARYMFSQHRITPEEHDRWFARVQGDESRRLWIIVADGADVGLASVSDIDFRNRRCSWAFYLADPTVRGKGVGSAVERLVQAFVFQHLQMNKLCCEVLASNPRAIHVYEKLGFVREGLRREHVLLDGGPEDVVVLGLLRRDWPGADLPPDGPDASSGG